MKMIGLMLQMTPRKLQRRKAFINASKDPDAGKKYFKVSHQKTQN